MNSLKLSFLKSAFMIGMIILFSSFSVSVASEEYTLDIANLNVEGNKVRMQIISTIPGTIEVMASLNLANQDPKDVYIGTSKKIKLIGGTAEVVLNVSELPTGNYEAEVNFYSNWGLADEKSKNSGITENMQVIKKIFLTGSGISAADEKKKQDGQVWVMENISMGTPWNANDISRRFGMPIELPVEGRNPNIIKAYYYSSIDMTLIVNVLKREITIWRMGRAHN